MKILQIKGTNVKTFKLTDITNITFYVESRHYNVCVYFGFNKTIVEIKSNLDDAGKTKTQKLYNDLMEAWLSATEPTIVGYNKIFIINLNKDDTVDSWQVYDEEDGYDKLFFPKERKFNVEITFESKVEMTVEAPDEQQAYQRASRQCGIDSDSANEQIIASAVEREHSVYVATK